jgi:large subunit ribosomal protein L17
MRHQKKGKILSRKTGPRKALVRALATSLVLYEKIQTTETKAKLIRPYVEKIITMGKGGSLHARREIAKKLYTEPAVKKVLEVLSPRYKERRGGYLRITKIGIRRGDAAKVAKIEFVK